MATKLSDREVRALVAPASGNRIEYDTNVKGFGARITSAGARSFILNYLNRRARKALTIGSFPDWTVAIAREQAKALKRRIDMGEDPMAGRDAAKKAPTVQGLADRYLAEHATRKRERSAAEDEALLRQHILPQLGRLRVDAVHRADIEALHRVVSKSTPIRANRVLALLSKMFSLSVGWEIRSDNPCRGIEKNHEVKRERYLTPVELERVMAASPPIPPDQRECRHACCCSLARGVAKCSGATWDQFDL